MEVSRKKDIIAVSVVCPLRLLILDFPSNLGAANAKQSAFMLSLAYDFMFKMLTDK